MLPPRAPLSLSPSLSPFSRLAVTAPDCLRARPRSGRVVGRLVVVSCLLPHFLASSTKKGAAATCSLSSGANINGQCKTGSQFPARGDICNKSCPRERDCLWPKYIKNLDASHSCPGSRAVPVLGSRTSAPRAWLGAIRCCKDIGTRVQTRHCHVDALETQTS